MATVKRVDPVEPVIYLLCIMMLIFSAMIIYCEHKFTSDGVIFTVFAGVLNNCSGALFMRIKSDRGKETGGDDNSVVISAPRAPDAPQQPVSPQPAA